MDVGGMRGGVGWGGMTGQHRGKPAQRSITNRLLTRGSLGVQWCSVCTGSAGTISACAGRITIQDRSANGALGDVADALLGEMLQRLVLGLEGLEHLASGPVTVVQLLAEGCECHASILKQNLNGNVLDARPTCG